jgi:hypothetical protein
MNEKLEVDPVVKALFYLADTVIFPSKFSLNEYNKHFSSLNPKNFVQVYHNDIKIDYDSFRIQKIKNDVINIGMMQKISPCKGEKYINYLKTRFRKYEQYEIRFLTVGDGIPPYDIKDFNKVVKSYNLHALMHLNAFADTYSYTLSYSMNTGLPIIYNNIGAYKERIPLREHYFKVYEHELDDNLLDYSLLDSQFEKLLDYIIANQKLAYDLDLEEDFGSIRIIYNEFYDSLFSPSS